MIKEITDATFEQETSEGLVLIDFWAAWCSPSGSIPPILEEIQEERGEKLKIVRIDIDENPETPRNLKVKSIPTLLIKKDGEIVKKRLGYNSKEELDEIINKYV
ncbi:thioredoxin [Listeria welshimeri]|uniref:thioredoxin n=1 Tax=Listeria welshimeri TaxID=1643 RepID=UPI0016248407|nr:thioredoxin [Listeria welshimeri]MBC1368991.1 thioredoxin [Listeria welshimeri]MBC1445546.1 thioredoxin [Listeria welshimeri]MBC1453883.1 thioredoxin [Listeria welshimeri]MBC1459724.1 thioredoxin [Listeria welshimeri]MBC1497737.1 thioredoxin [Listeria welshimeri]